MVRSKLNLFHLNVCSLQGKREDIKTILYNNNIDVLAISETWLNEKIETSYVTIDGYTFLRRDRGSRGGGVGLYISNSLKFKKITSSGEIEQLWKIRKDILEIRVQVGDARKRKIGEYMDTMSFGTSKTLIFPNVTPAFKQKEEKIPVNRIFQNFVSKVVPEASDNDAVNNKSEQRDTGDMHRPKQETVNLGGIKSGRTQKPRNISWDS
nr:unnamed protein product [Callosobruchus analis]